jgi:hypothetical protein
MADKMYNVLAYTIGPGINYGAKIKAEAALAEDLTVPAEDKNKMPDSGRSALEGTIVSCNGGGLLLAATIKALIEEELKNYGLIPEEDPEEDE